MGGGAMHVDLPMIQFCTSSSSKLPSSPSSSSSSSNLNLPVSVNNNSTTSATLKQSCNPSSSCSCHSDSCREVDRPTEEKRASGLLHNIVSGPVPSTFEVANAVSALQSFIMHGISSSGSDSRWIQPFLGSLDPRISLSQGYGRKIYDTFRMLLTDPTIKRLVVSLASDRAVWDAVINNELLQKLLESPYSAEIGGNHNSGKEPNLIADILKWILDITKAKVTELIEKFQALMDEVIFRHFDSDQNQNPTEETRGDWEDKVRSSFLLSIVILVIVVMSRAHG